MENKLIPLSDFVLQEFKKWENKDTPAYQSTAKYVFNTKIYAEFLKQLLALWMFVPCDENNVPLEFIEYETWTGSDEEYNEYTHKYFEAKSRVLFEGFALNGAELFNKELNISIYLDTYEYVEHHDNGYGGGNLSGINIEALANAHLKITLTETAKQIYGS